ncbi:MAG: BrnT family toxin [Rhizobiaceae bacterium]
MEAVDRIEFAKFDWDENKRQLSLAKSGVDFIDASMALLGPQAPSPHASEQRIKAIANSNGRIVVVIFLVRDEATRIISAWPADKNEQREYRHVYGG